MERRPRDKTSHGGSTRILVGKHVTFALRRHVRPALAHGEILVSILPAFLRSWAIRKQQSPPRYPHGATIPSESRSRPTAAFTRASGHSGARRSPSWN